jgi:hypothetical protein
MAGSALAETGHSREAAAELERAIILYDEGPRPGEHHGVAGQALARTDLAMIRLRSGALDAGAAALAPVLALPAGQRLVTLTPGWLWCAVSLPRRSSGPRSRPGTSATRSRTSAGRPSPRGCTP